MKTLSILSAIILFSAFGANASTGDIEIDTQDKAEQVKRRQNTGGKTGG